MKQHLLGVVGAVVVASALVLAQQAGPAQSTAQTPPAPKGGSDVTVTGCLIQGSDASTFLLDNARTATQSRTEKGQTYMLVASGEDLGFAQQLNHEVSITGSADQKTPPPVAAGQKVNEKDLPKLNASALTMVSDRCTTSSH
jgi:hypothetical protein